MDDNGLLFEQRFILHRHYGDIHEGDDRHIIYFCGVGVGLGESLMTPEEQENEERYPGSYRLKPTARGNHVFLAHRWIVLSLPVVPEPQLEERAIKSRWSM